MITPKQRRQLESAIANLVRKSIDNSWVGAQDPTDQHSIRTQTVKAKQRMKKLLNNLENPGDTNTLPK